MALKILKNSSQELEAEIENVTIAEILRVYLNKDSTVTFAAWKKEHITKNHILLVKTKGKTSKKAIADAVKTLMKDLDNLENNVKKLK